jgi:hypothetical protein
VTFQLSTGAPGVKPTLLPSWRTCEIRAKGGGRLLFGRELGLFEENSAIDCDEQLCLVNRLATSWVAPPKTHLHNRHDYEYPTD